MKRRQSLFQILMVLLGNTFYGLGVTLFILPAGIITGGTTGLALFFQHTLQVPLGLFVAAFNILMFLFGAWVLGKTFALTTILSTFYYPLAFQVMNTAFGDTVLTTDPMLAAICAGLLIGAGIGMVMRAGASTGGMDIPPLILNHYTGFPISISLYAFDVIILFLQIFFSNTEQVLYGILLVLIYSITLDQVLVFGNNKVEVKIISPCYEAINLAVRQQLDRGVTLIDGAGGFTDKNTRIVLTVLSNRELVQLNRLVAAIDSDAFMVISQVKEVRGRGFTLDKKYQSR